MRSASIWIVAATLAACAPGAVPRVETATPAQCVALFQRFDALEWRYGTQSALDNRRVAPPALMLLGIRIQRAGCFTASSELDAMAGVADPRIADSGPTIVPTSLHVGVVSSMTADAQALAFFRAAGVRARSVGSASLGRRIYLGPFGTAGALASAADLARRAGFASPYPAAF